MEGKKEKRREMDNDRRKSFHPPFLGRQLNLHMEVIRTIDESPITYKKEDKMCW